MSNYEILSWFFFLLLKYNTLKGSFIMRGNSYCKLFYYLHIITSLLGLVLTWQLKLLYRRVYVVYNVSNIRRTLQSDTYRPDWYATCRGAATSSIRPKYLARPIIHAPMIAIRGIRRPWGILTSVILSPSDGERTRWEKFFLVRHSQRVTFFFRYARR